MWLLFINRVVFVTYGGMGQDKAHGLKIMTVLSSFNQRINSGRTVK